MTCGDAFGLRRGRARPNGPPRWPGALVTRGRETARQAISVSPDVRRPGSSTYKKKRSLTLQTDRQFRVAGCWALASDGVQWVLQYRAVGTKRWQAVKFVRSTKDHLACRLRELAVPSRDAERLLEGLPDSFDEWARHDALDGEGDVALAEQPNWS